MSKYTFNQAKCNVAEIANRDSYTKDFIFELMAAYGLSASSISQLKSGIINKSSDLGTWLQSGVIFAKLFPPDTSLEDEAKEMDMDPLSERYQPRYIIATDLKNLVAKDRIKHKIINIAIKDIDNEVAFFYGWINDVIDEDDVTGSIADRRAAIKMKELYDEIELENNAELQNDPLQFRHDLNVFFSRLLFCFFAEDTGLFAPRQFASAVKEFTKTDGSDLQSFFTKLFQSLGSKDKTGLSALYSGFPYIGESLFGARSRAIVIPRFTPNARHLLLLCADLDWSEVNPDIFGTIFQGVVDERRRDENGMDYTSVTNILKVIDPLFMDNLRADFEQAFNDADRLLQLRSRIASIKVFDPACGSGNFLIISYKKLRELEHDIIRRISDLHHDSSNIASGSMLRLDHFFGIELEDFPCELAILSLHIAAHQMDIEFTKEFGQNPPDLSLAGTPTIICGNSTQIDWCKICPNHGADEIYLIGNPPYKGCARQSPSQKQDFKTYFQSEPYSTRMDYIAIWFIKGARYIAGTRAKLAFVSTSSLCQGEQPNLVFPKIFAHGLEIAFAHTPFKWSNHAKDPAGVTVVIVELQNIGDGPKTLFHDGTRESVAYINAYLVPSTQQYITPQVRPISNFPYIGRANALTDGGNFGLSESECHTLQALDANLVKNYYGAEEFINARKRPILWLDSKDQYEKYSNNNIIHSKVHLIRDFRRNLKSGVGRQLAQCPWRAKNAKSIKTSAIIIPRVSSAHREYIPMGFLSSRDVIGDTAIGAYDAEPWLFAVLQSKMHMAWIRTVCGRFKADYRYSSTLGYNAFPCPRLTSAQKKQLDASARNILSARASHPELTPAKMYDPDKMPTDLRRAHTENDVLVDGLYRSAPFQDDASRLATLFKLYAQMVSD